MSVWVLYRHDLSFFDGILHRLIGSEELATLFWLQISEPYGNHLHQSLTKNSQGFRRETFEYHGHLMLNLKRGLLCELFIRSASTIHPQSSRLEI